MRNTLPPFRFNDVLCGAYFDELNAGRRRRNGKAVFAQTFDVKLNGFLYECENFVTGFRNRHTTRQVGNMRPETGFTLFDHDCVFHNVILFQTGLFENGVKRGGRHVDVWFSANGHGATLRWMFELPVATFSFELSTNHRLREA